MLTEKPWKADAILRLFLSVFVCIYAGSVLASLLHHTATPRGITLRAWVAAAGSMVCFLGTLVVLRKPWTPGKMGKQLTIMLVLFYGALLAGALVQRWCGPPGSSVLQMVLAALSFQGAALVLVVFFLREQQMTWTEAFGLQRNVRRAVIAGLLLAIGFLPVGWVMQQLANLAITHLPYFSLKPEEQQAVQTLRTAVSSMDRITLGMVTILLAPVAEEVLFRGILYPWIAQLGFPRMALWGTSVLFALVHMNLITFLPLLALALLLARLYRRTGNLLAAVVAHSAFNALNFGLLYFLGG